MPMFDLGEWLPDQQPIALPGLTEVRNAYPTLTGYQSFNGGNTLPGISALTGEVKGAYAGDTQKGVHFIIAGEGSGTDSKIKIIYSHGDWVDISPGGTVIDISASGKWSFTTYGNRIIACGRDATPVSVDTTTSDPKITHPLSSISADASEADVCAVFKEFLILGNVVGQGVNASAIGTQRGGLHWSAIGDPTNWPAVGTQAAIDAQSDFQILDGDGGEITAIVPAGEYCAVFRKNQVWRMDYVGGTAFFSFRRIDTQRGCIIPGCAVAVGGTVYFPSAEGFMAFNGSELIPIGEEKIDRTWRQTMDFNSKEKVNGVYQAESESIFWTVSEGGGTPVLIYGYRHALGKWFTLEGETAGWLVNTAATVTGGNLDNDPYASFNLDNCDPADTPGTNDGTWAVSTAYLEGDVVKSALGSPDDVRVYRCSTAGTSGSGACPLTGEGSGITDGTAVWGYAYDVNTLTALQDSNLDKIGIRDGDRALGMFDSTNNLKVYNDTEATLQGRITTGDFEVPDGQRGVLRWVRPIYSGTGGFSGSAATRLSPNDPIIYIPLTWKDAVGVLTSKSAKPASSEPLGGGFSFASPFAVQRIGGRYIRATFQFDTPVTKFSGFDTELRSSTSQMRTTR